MKMEKVRGIISCSQRVCQPPLQNDEGRDGTALVRSTEHAVERERGKKMEMTRISLALSCRTERLHFRKMQSTVTATIFSLN